MHKEQNRPALPQGGEFVYRVFHDIPLPLVVTGIEGKILFANKEFARLVGTKLQILSGKELLEIMELFEYILRYML
ncbi:MAG: hypothetical protein HPY80_03260 [Bacteroidales bacterium]|nr:hypothetical protein [Bacteroidales bacterium]